MLRSGGGGWSSERIACIHSISAVARDVRFPRAAACSALPSESQGRAVWRIAHSRVRPRPRRALSDGGRKPDANRETTMMEDAVMIALFTILGLALVAVPLVTVGMQ